MAAQEEVAAELAPEVLELASHPFGNYLVSRLAHLPSLQPHLVARLRGHVLELMTHAQGSRVVQAAMSALPASDTLALVHEIDGHILECSLDTHGSFGVCVSFRHTHAPFILAQLARQIDDYEGEGAPDLEKTDLKHAVRFFEKSFVDPLLKSLHKAQRDEKEQDAAIAGEF